MATKPTTRKKKPVAAEAVAAEPVTSVVAYKAFDKDLSCRGFKYEIGKTFTHSGRVSICDSGFHACEDPLDVLNYYDITSSRFARVTMTGKVDRKGEGDSKICGASITIDAELKLPDFIAASIKWIANACKVNSSADGQVTTGHYATNASSGDSATNASSGDSATNASSGHYAKNASSGHYAKNASSGDSATNASSGHSAKNASSGHYAKNASSGDSATNASSGHSAKNASSGHYATNASSGDSATNASSGHYAKNASSGDSATNASSGHSAKNASSGDYATNASSGDSATNASSGHSAKNASSGDSATNASSGHYAKNASSGDYGYNEATGEYAVITGAGRETRYKGAKGVWISAAEYAEVSGKYVCIGFAVGQAGYGDVPADTWLVARGGKLVSA